MAKTLIVVTHARSSDYQGTASMKSRSVIRYIQDFLSGCFAGAYPGATAVDVAQTQATGNIIILGGAGTITATINGVATSVTWAASDTATAVALAAAINANTDPLVRRMVTASASAGIVTITADRPGLCGNAITLAATGTGTMASGARLTGGVGNFYTF